MQKTCPLDSFKLIALRRGIMGEVDRCAALVGVAAGLLKACTRREQEQHVRDGIERFKLDPTKPADAAALAFRWAQNKGPWLFDIPQKCVVRANPTMLDSGISDLILHDLRELTPEQVVDEALKREADHARQNGKA